MRPCWWRGCGITVPDVPLRHASAGKGYAPYPIPSPAPPRYTARMSGNTFFFILILAAMIATVVALVRGIIAFLRTSEADLKGGGVSQSGLKQNKAMRMRIAFQAIAVILVILMLMMSRGS